MDIDDTAAAGGRAGMQLKIAPAPDGDATGGRMAARIYNSERRYIWNNIMLQA